MAYGIMRQGDTDVYNLVTVEVDNKEDIDTLPTDWAAGSVCIVREDSTVFMLGLDKTWKKF